MQKHQHYFAQLVILLSALGWRMVDWSGEAGVWQVESDWLHLQNLGCSFK